jgi:hypothetical protein
MQRVRLLVSQLIFLLACVAAQAAGPSGSNNLLLLGVSAPGINANPPSNYQGPGDIVAAGAWYGLRAYNNVLANAGATTTPVIDVRGATTATSCTIFLLGNGTGNLDLTTAGSGSVGNQCLLGATTFCTVTNTSCTVSKIYDQSSGLLCTTSCPLSQGTTGAQPTLTFNCINTSLPCLTGAGGQGLINSSFSSSIGTPNTQASVASRTGAFTSTGAITSTAGAQFRFTTSTNTVQIVTTGATLNATAADSAAHAFMAVTFASGTNSVIYVDNTATSGNLTTAGSNKILAIMMNYVGGENMTGYWMEGGLWETNLTSGNASSMCHNQFTYWATSTSC